MLIFIYQPHLPFLAFKNTSYNLSHLKGEGLVAPSIIIPSDNVQRSVKHKLHFDESK